MVLKPKTILKTTLFSMAFSALLLTGCSGDEVDPGTDTTQPPIGEDLKNKTGFQVELDGQIISIPSPIQTAFLIQKSGASFSETYINPADNYSLYSTKFRKALNLGVYGADMGYVTIYDNNDQAVKYLNAIQIMASDLDVAGAFDKQMIDRFSSNMGNEDTMLTIVAEAFRQGDTYLKNNDRNEVATLILAGGWIEALYFATSVAKDDGSPEVITRIGEQKKTLENLTLLVGQYYNDESFAELYDNLVDLQASFEAIETKYVYEKPVTHPEKKLTVIDCKSEVTMSDATLQEIADKVSAMRNEIIG